MANHCWNLITISGSDIRIKKLKKFLESNETEDIYNQMTEKYGSNDYGSRWFESNFDLSIDGYVYINGSSAWSPPTELSRLISEKFKVNVKHEYSEQDNDFAGFDEFQEGELVGGIQMGYREYLTHTKEYDELFQSYYLDEVNMFNLEELYEAIGYTPLSIELTLGLILYTFNGHYQVPEINKKWYVTD
jgi:hypothetical protein